MGSKGNEKRELPKNIRQIGEAGKEKRVYLEDYAITYIRQVKAAVLLGETARIRGARCYFISGAVEVPEGDFDEENWKVVLEEAEKSFPNLDVVGWFLRAEEIPEELNEEDMHVYKEHFPGKEAILVVYNELEKEEAVYLTLDGFLRKQTGYYIYYEKNQQMQEYLVSKNVGRSVEKEAVVSDNAIRSFRKIIESKNKKKEEELELEEQQENLAASQEEPVKKKAAKKKEEESSGEELKQVQSEKKEPEESGEEEEILENPKIFNIRLPQRSGKKEATPPRVKTLHFLYTASTFMVLTILVIGVTMINNYDKMKKMEQTMAHMTENTPVSAGVARETETEAMKQTVIDVRTGETEILNGILEESELPTEKTSEAEAAVQNLGEAGGQPAASQGVQNQVPEGQINGLEAENQAAGENLPGIEGTYGTEAGVSQGQSTEPGNGQVSQGGVNSADQAAGGQVPSSEGSTGGALTGTTEGEGNKNAAAANGGALTASEPPAHASQASYTIKFGDTLADICARYYGSTDKLQEICDLNQIVDPNSILPGQKLVLP